ncbi:MAG: GGDEF domain-containing protein [Magnetovibrio sp.]|nr:GGDEF domain-containing protein [Magnetovibrio sp.]
MIFHDSVEQAAEYGQGSLGEMAKRKIPATPDNFAVWYTHISGREPDLSRMITILEDNDQDFTEVVCTDLYNKFFSSGIDEVTLNDTTDRIEKELTRILGYVGEAGEGAAEFGDTLASAQGDILGSKDVHSLKIAVTKVLTETRKMEETNKVLENQLADSTDEIGQLRDDLEDMRKEALTDALTGIANRKLFDMELRSQARDAMETGESLCLLMLDIDHFKKFNDTFGHQTGDQVLKLLASTMTKAVKGNDIPARYGGEEFTVILPQTDLPGAKQVAESIRQRVSSKTLVNRTTKEDLGKLTISVGVSKFEFGESLTDFLKRADQALYKAKNSGRDCVVSQDDLDSDVLDFE